MSVDLAPSVLLLVAAGGFTGAALCAGFLCYRNQSLSKRIGDAPIPSQNVRSSKSSSFGTDQSAPVKKSTTKEFPGGKVCIYFGSQTGTAEGFATELAQEGREHGFDAQAVDLEDFDGEEFLQQRAAIFIVATYGEGEPTDNALQFYKWLKDSAKDLEEDAAKSLGFTVFGLGNRQYEHYNFMGKFVSRRLRELSGEEVYTYGEGDDDGSLEEDFETWKENLWSAFVKKFRPDAAGGKGSVAEGEGPLEDVAFCVKYIGDAKNASKDLSLPMVKSEHEHVEIEVVCNRELRQKTVDGSTRHIELDISKGALTYEIADNLAVLPENSDEEVTRLVKRLGVDPNLTFVLLPSDPASKEKLPFPVPCTVETALQRYCDILTPPRKSALKIIAHFAADEKEKAKLRFMASKEGKEMYHSEIEEPMKTFTEVLEDFPSVSLPLDRFLSLAPRLHPRYYTISSSPTVHKTSIHITVSVVSQGKSGGRFHLGVCSNYLARLGRDSSLEVPKVEKTDSQFTRGRKLRAFVRPSTFKLPVDHKRPIILIGPGTGFAPMRAFLQERRYQRKQHADVGKTIVYFGCRKEEEDFIYADEIKEYLADGTLNKLYTAFSRDTPVKVYVQNRLMESGKETWKLLEDEGAYVYVCGGTSMGHDVMETFRDIVVQQGGLGQEEAAVYIKKMQETGRYVQELWS